MSNDDAAVTGTQPIAERHRFDFAALEAWLAPRIVGFRGPIAASQFKGGQSNPTFRLDTPERSYVMRCKPGPAAKLLPSAHAIEREYRVMHALAASDVPVARMLALCDDEAVIGRAFYVMEHVEGRVLWDQGLPRMDKAARGAIYDELNRVIAALHRVDYSAVDLADYGKPGNYFERQLGRWTKQYQASVTEPIEAMDRLIEWLPAHMPTSALDTREVAIVHGDFRLDNVIFHAHEPHIVAVLDWELSTLGHPLADFSYHCMAWHIPHAMGRGTAGLDLAGLGIPLERAYIERYAQRTGRDAVAIERDWPFYIAYNLFRIAAILQGIAKRALDGTASSAQAVEAGAGARPLAELGWQHAQRG